MAKKVKTVIKVNAMGGAANPAPPIGPALGQNEHLHPKRL